MDPYLSQKLRHLSFLLMGMVALIHGYNLNLSFSDWGSFRPSYELSFLQAFLSDGICRVAVPMFFAISGYLATRSLGAGFTGQGYLKLLQKRIHSLVIPYLLVSGLGILTVVVLQLIPFSAPFFNNYNLETTTPGRWLWIWLRSPVPYPLWFIRFLFFYFLLFPVIYGFARYLKLVYLIGLVYFWSCYELQQSIGLIKVEVEGAVFFSFGVFAATSGVNLLYRPPANGVKLALLLWLGWIAYRTHLALSPHLDHYAVHHHLIGFTLVGFFVFWFSYDLISDWLANRAWFVKNAYFSIGVFLFHEPALTIFKKILIRLAGHSDSSLLLAFLLAPVLGFAFGLLLSRLFYRYLPTVYTLFTGNRKPA